MITGVPSVLFVAAFDSQLKWCGHLRDELAARGFGWRVVVPDVRSALSPEQISGAGFDRVEHLAWPKLLAAAQHSDVVVSGLAGPLTQGLILDLVDARDRTTGPGPGPVVVSGWVGVIIEKTTAGYLDRCAADVVAVNSRTDLAHFAEVARPPRPAHGEPAAQRAADPRGRRCPASPGRDPQGAVRRPADGAPAGRRAVLRLPGADPLRPGAPAASGGPQTAAPT